MRNLEGVLFVVCLASCSAGSDDSDSTVTVAEPLSNSEHCDTAPADATVTGFPAGAVGTPPYGDSQCANAYVVDVPAPFPRNVVQVSVGWHGSVPGNSADCAATRVLSYSWQGSTGLDDLSSRGQWVNGACQIPRINMPAFSDGTRRYAISARWNNTVQSVDLSARLSAGGSFGF